MFSLFKSKSNWNPPKPACQNNLLPVCGRDCYTHTFGFTQGQSLVKYSIDLFYRTLTHALVCAHIEKGTDLGKLQLRTLYDVPCCREISVKSFKVLLKPTYYLSCFSYNSTNFIFIIIKTFPPQHNKQYLQGQKFVEGCIRLLESWLWESLDSPPFNQCVSHFFCENQFGFSYLSWGESPGGPLTYLHVLSSSSRPSKMGP